MSVIELTRQLGAAIQADERYKAFDEAKKANDADKELNDLIGKINLVQMNYQNEAAKGEEANAETMEGFAKEFEQLYREIMLNGNMVKFEAAKTAIDLVIRKKIPKSTHGYYLTSLIRLSEDDCYINKIKELMESRAQKGKKDKYYNFNK